MQDDRCPKALGAEVKSAEIQLHHEVTNQYLWSKIYPSSPPRPPPLPPSPCGRGGTRGAGGWGAGLSPKRDTPLSPPPLPRGSPELGSRHPRGPAGPSGARAGA